MARELMQDGEFIGVFVDTSLAEAEERDMKGLYAKVCHAKIKHFTGISSSSEAPKKPEIRVDTGSVTAEVAADLIVQYLKVKGRLTKTWQSRGAGRSWSVRRGAAQKSDAVAPCAVRHLH
jgi:bifunctional enzyme CysN/CysC